MAASTSRKSYASSQTPVLVMTITNVGSSACRLNVGTSQQDFSVSSGSDRIYSSSDCLADPTDVDITIKAGSVGNRPVHLGAQAQRPGLQGRLRQAAPRHLRVDREAGRDHQRQGAVRPQVRFPAAGTARSGQPAPGTAAT